MSKYHKITTLWKREDKKPHNMIVGDYALPEFEQLAKTQWVWTEKVDGTNVRVMWDGHNVVFGGRTDNAQLPTPLFQKLSELFSGTVNEQVFEQVFGESPAILFGEGYGNKIQAVGKDYNPDGVDFILFDVKVDGTYLERENVEDVASKFDIQAVPIIGEGTLLEAAEIVTKGFTSKLADLESEGIVARPKVELLDRRGNRIVTKLKTKDFRKLGS